MCIVQLKIITDSDVQSTWKWEFKTKFKYIRNEMKSMGNEFENLSFRDYYTNGNEGILI